MVKLLNKLKPVHWLLVVIILAGAFLRLYNLPGSMMFLGDQGRDAIIVKDIFKKFDPVFIGPVTSVGNMYLGPGYYYFMLPWLWFSYPSPVGPAYAVAVLGIITIYLMYKLGKELVGEPAAIIATTFFAFSSTVINNTRFSWNPNPAPLVSLLMVFFTYRAWKKNPKYWIGAAVCFSILIQLHYLTLLSATGAGLIWLISIFEKRKNAKYLKKLFFATLISFLIFVVSLTPIILFDIKHDYLNTKAFTQMISGQENFAQNTTEPLMEKVITVTKETHGRGMHILFEITVGKNRQLNTWLLVFTFIIWSALFINHKKFKLKNDDFQGEFVIFIYLVTGIIGTSFYEHTIFDHYIAYLFPITFLTFGIVIAAICSRSFLAKIVTMMFFFYFLIFNFGKYNITTQEWSMFDVKRTAESVLEHLEVGEKYNIVLLSHTGDLYGQNYRYFMDVSDKPPLKPEQSPDSDTLVIIKEDDSEIDLETTSIYEISIFPDKTPKEVYNVEGGPEVTILRKK